MIRKATQVEEDEGPVVGWDIQPLSPDTPGAYLAGSMIGARAEPLVLRVLGLRRGDVVMPPDCREWVVVQRCRDRRRAGSRSALYRSPGERRQLCRVALLSAMLVYLLVYLTGVTVPGVRFAELVVVAGVVFVTYCQQGALPASAATATDHALAELRGRTGPPVPRGDELADTMRRAAQGLTPEGRRALHECVYLPSCARASGSAPASPPPGCWTRSRTSLGRRDALLTTSTSGAGRRWTSGTGASCGS